MSAAIAPRRAMIALLCLLAAAGTSCGGGSTAGPPPRPVGAYDDLGECGRLPAGVDQAALDGLDLPPGMVVTDVTAADPLLQVTGLIDATPLQIRDSYATDATLMHLEDEGFEAEILLDRGAHRVFIKATIRCRTGSVISLIRAPGDAADALPVPGQLASPAAARDQG